jgi:hypothetical protein
MGCGRQWSQELGLVSIPPGFQLQSQGQVKFDKGRNNPTSGQLAAMSIKTLTCNAFAHD